MIKYRLTKRGKAVFTIFIIILFCVCFKISAIAQNSLIHKTDAVNDNILVIDSDTSELHNYVTTNDSINHKDSITVINDLSNSYMEELSLQSLSANNNKNATLSVSVEQAYVQDGKKVAFLTFDDGPSRNITPQVLEILDDYNIKATFFVLGSLSEKNSDILVKIAESGHAIGIHTYSHKYKAIYSSTDNLINEVKKTDNVLKQILGNSFHTRLFRFPGGSFGDSKKHFKTALINEGYTFIDWNALNGDGESSVSTPQKLLERFKSTAGNKRHLVILMHDSASKKTTVQTLPQIIEYLNAQGYEFAILN